MLLLALALAPGIAIIFFIIARDRYDREPFGLLLKSFFLGVLSCVPALFIQLGAEKLASGVDGLNPTLYRMFLAFVIVAFSEEGSKYFMLVRSPYRNRAFNEPLDGIVYSLMIGMGFATLENIGYVYQHGVGTGILRMVLSVPAHGCFAVLMGYYVGLAKFNPARAAGLKLKGLLLAAFFHGAFNCFLFLQEDALVTQYVSTTLLFLGAVVSYLIALRMSLRLIRMHRQLSKQLFNERN